uniref:Arrestin C-terminal-like domain-containing protein n=1 Tax=Monopterus albus TaxID=43700 RepID=A0A3Q3QJ46_MONAL
MITKINISILGCFPLNKSNIFTSELSKECKIFSLHVKLKGKAEAKWMQSYRPTEVKHYSKGKYFSINFTIFLVSFSDSSVVAPGCHVYPFTFQFPYQGLPSSFSGCYGKILYTLEARLGRSMRIDKKDSTKLNFVSKADLHSDPLLMTPQHESKDKKMHVFSSGTVAMDVNLEKTGFIQGEGLKVVAYIQNNSSREIKPKYCVYRKHSFFAKGKRKVSTNDLCKEVGEPIPPSSNANVTKVITIPPDMEPSILNCNIIKVEYRLRVSSWTLATAM